MVYYIYVLENWNNVQKHNGLCGRYQNTMEPGHNGLYGQYRCSCRWCIGPVNLTLVGLKRKEGAEDSTLRSSSLVSLS